MINVENEKILSQNNHKFINNCYMLLNRNR